MKQETHLGWGSIKEAESVLARYNTASVFLVAGKNSYQSSGAAKALTPVLARRRVIVFSDFTENPKSDDIERGAALFRQDPCDLILVVGGGSALDTAKLIRAAASEYKPLVAVPTTAGTGSEATHFAVVYRDGKKSSIANGLMLPDVAIVDPALTESMSPRLTAVTGLDALAQAVESHWAIASTDESKRCAISAMERIVEHFVGAITAPTKQAREAMAYASNEAGQAINITKTTAPHALSYVFTSRFGVPHGHAVALTLGSLIEYNAGVTEADAADPRGPEHVRKNISEMLRALRCESAAEARQKIESYMGRAGLATRLSDLGVSAEDIASCVESVNTERLANNPRRLAPESIVGILKSLL